MQNTSVVDDAITSPVSASPTSENPAGAGSPAAAAKPFWPVIRRSTLGRCPNCGKGKLFRSYLKQVDACSECHEALGHIRADDGPAWFTMVLVGHLIAPAMLLAPITTDTPMWVMITALVVPSALLMLACLPFAKGMFIGLIWRMGCIGSER